MAELKEYEIWSETKTITGKSGCHFHGSEKAKDFKAACVKFAKVNEDFYAYFNSKNMKYFGCKLFDNSDDAITV